MKLRGFILLLWMGIAIEVSVESCSVNEFSCTDQKLCVGKAFVCDDNPNCLDKSDEEESLCETWDYEYEYEDEDEGGGLFGGGGGSEEVEKEVEESKPKPKPKPEQESKVAQKESVVEGTYAESDNLRQMCSLNKCRPKGSLSFKDGREYRYTYELFTKTEAVREKENQTASSLVKCDVIIQVLTACEMYIKVENVVSKSSNVESGGQPSNTDENVEFLRAIEGRSLRFSMLGGEVDFVCPLMSEDKRALNFKRGILSMLQNTMPKLHVSHTQREKDVVGECDMIYQFQGSNGPRTIVSKTRDLPSCTSRSHITSMAQGVPYDFPLTSNPLEIIQSESKCTQEIKSGIILDASCHERHDLTPFRSDQGQIATTIDQKLSYVSEGFFLTKWEPVEQRTDIIFTHTILHKEIPSEVYVSLVNSLLDRLGDSSYTLDSENRSPSSDFKRLVDGLRRLSLEQLRKVNTDREWKELDRQYFLDAVSNVGSASSVRFMASEMPTLTTEKSVVKSWVDSLRHIQSPDYDTISAAADILEVDDIPNDVFLSLGSLLNTYCMSHPACQTHEPVINLMNSFRQVIKSECKAKNLKEKLQVLFALRGIGNGGLAVNSYVIEALNKCLYEEGNEAEITATAIDAFRRIPCNVSRSSLETILKDTSKDSEIRILSYLGMMKCANYETLHLVENLFQNEQVNQVGSFIWTHLTNLQESNVPSKIDVQSLLSNRVFEEKFKSDFRKYSKNIEMSGFYDPLNVGGSVESNIIFSEKSYVPRQTSLNLTADLFGRSYNLFEMSARFEGFEKYIEQLITGITAQPNSKEIKSKNIKNLLKQSGRKKEYLLAEPQISVNMKTFGNDISYQHLNGMKDISSLLNTFSLESVVQSLQQGKKIALKKSYLPLDSQFELSTCAGLPLRLNIEGSATVDSSVQFQLDISGVMQGKAKLKGHFKPNLSVNLKTSMILDGYSSSNGIEMDSSFHSSVMIDGVVDVDGKNAISVDFNLPQEKMDIFKFSSRLALIHGFLKPGEQLEAEREEVVNPLVPPSVTSDCLLIDYAFGIRLCYRNQNPQVDKSPFNHRILLNGPLKYNVELVKRAPKSSSYKFRYRYTNDDKNLLFYILYDTPGSVPQGKHNFKVEINYLNSQVLLNYNTPRYTLDAKGQYIWNPEVKRLNASVNYNGQGEALIDAGYKVHERNEQSIVIPILQIIWKNNELVSLKGNLEARERAQTSEIIHYGVDLNFVVNTQATGPEGQRVEGIIKGFLNKENNDWELSLDVSYIFPGAKAWENVKIYYKRVMQASEQLLKMIRTWKVSFSQFPHLNTKGNWASKTFAGSTENAIKASFGSNYENPLNEVDLFQNFIFYGGNEQTFNTTIAIKYPIKQLDVKIGADLFHDLRDINMGFVVQYASGNAINSRFHLIRSISGPIKTEGSFDFFMPSWIDVKTKGEIQQTELDTYKIDFVGSVNTHRLELFGYYTDLSTRLKQLHKLELKIKLPSRDVVYSNSTFLYDANQLAAAVQMKTKDGSKYKIRLAYISQFDDFSAHQRKIEIDLVLPQRSYYWHSEITFGKYITISNDIHFDSYRDISLWIQFYKHKDEPTSVNLKLLWDANRDPHKRATLDVTLGDNSVVLVSSISFFGNEYKFTWRSSKDWKSEYNRLASWSHHHAGEFSWNDNRREVHRISFGGNFNLIRNVGARLTADVYLRTPLETWKDNTIKIEYSRSAESIIASLNSKWHKDEFLNLNFNSGLTRIENGLKIESKVEVLSFINENMVSFSAGAHLAKTKRNLDGTVFIKWDKDEVQFIIEAKNESTGKDIRMSAVGKIMTTLKGYRLLSASVDLYATSGSLTLYGATKWEDTLYELKCNGVLYSAMEYLKGEVFLTTPQYGPDTASAKIRVYHDPATHDEKLMITGHWLNEELELNGRVLAQPKDFRAELNVNTPFPKLSQASMSLGHSTKEFYMSEVWFRWNNTKDLGLKIVSRLNTLTNFLMSLTVKTPFSKFKEIKGELRNLFELSPSVNVNSMIYGQMDNKKYGLGAIYYQGISPKLRVGLEMYYPSPGLEEVKFDISDNSSETNMRYNFEFKHGPDKQININTDFKKTHDSVEFSFGSGITLESILGPGFEKVNLEGETKMYWEEPLGFELRLASRTPQNTNKIFAKGWLRDEQGSIEGNLALPFKHLEDLEYFFKVQIPDDERKGIIDAKLSTGRIPHFTLNCEGDDRSVTAKFTSQIENYRRGHLEYKLIHEDVERSRVEGSCSLEDKEILFQGYIYLYEDQSVKLEIDATTPFQGYKTARLTLASVSANEGVKDMLTFNTGDMSYEGEIYRMIDDKEEWIFRAKIINMKEETDPYTLALSYKARSGDPILLSFKAESPLEGYKLFSSLIKIQYAARPYDLTLEWDIPVSSGKLDLVLESFSKEKIFGSASLSLEGPEKPFQMYKMKLRLENRSTRNEVDLGLYTEINSTLKKYDHIIVDGKLKQVTSKPGLLQVYLVWPELDPVNFTAVASYSGLPSFDLRASANLNITSAYYGIIGEVQREGNMLNLKSGLFWQKADFSLQKISFLSSFEMTRDALSGHAELRLPMVPGFEVNTADIVYSRNDDLRILSLALDAGKTRTTIESALNSKDFPAAEGNITIASSEFREGNPIILNFNQALTSEGYRGEYEFEWPVWDLKTRSYGREFVRAILNHSYLPKGQEGVLQLISPLTKGKPISLSYSFVFPKKPDVTIKLGIGYEYIKFEVKVSHEVAESANKRIRKSSVEFDNLIWPFGIAYLETISLHTPNDKETNDVLMIYDLQNTDRRSSLSLIRRSSSPEESRFSIKGMLVEREIEFSVGYKSTPDLLSGDVILSWSPTEKVQLDYEWKLKSSSYAEKNYLLKARLSQPLRTVLLETIYILGEETLSLDLTLNTNLEDSSEVPLKVIANYGAKRMAENERHITGEFKISHSSLENDIHVSAEYQRHYLFPLLLKFLLRYSPDPEKDLSIQAYVKRIEGERSLEDSIDITHAATKLNAKADGKIVYGSGVYSFDQRFVYTKADGQELVANLDGGIDLKDKSLHTQVESSKRLLDLKLKIREKGKGHWELRTSSDTHDSFPMSTSLKLHPSQPIFVLTIESLKSQKVDRQETVVEDPEYPRYLARKVVLEGGLEDQRFAHLSMRHLPSSVLLAEGNDTRSWTRDLNFAFRLNNSKLISSHVEWRKRVEEEIKNEMQELMGMTQDLRADVKEWVRTAVMIAGNEALQRTKPILKDVVSYVKPLLAHLKNESKDIKNDFYLLFKNVNMTRKEKDLKESVMFAVSNIGASLSQLKIVERVKERLAQGTLRLQVANFIQKIKEFYASILERDPSFGKLIEKVKEMASSFASAYDNAVKKWYLMFRNAVDDFKMRLSDWLRTKWHNLYNNYKPHILRTLHHIEAASYTIISQIWDSMNKLGANFKSLSYVQMMEQIYEKLKYVYDEMAKRTLRQNLEWVYQYTVTHVRKGVDAFFARILPFINDWLDELKSAWEKFTTYESIRSLVDFCSGIGRTISWTFQKIDFSDFFLDALAFTIEHGYTIMTQTGIDAQLRNIEAKTDLTWTPSKGEIKFVQKLPFDWIRFEQSPAFKELLETPYLSPLRKLFSSPKFSLLDSWYKYFNLNFDPRTWIPPFSAIGYIVGENHILTFDGKLIKFKGTCEHLLAADLIHHNWAASVKFNKYTPKTINVFIEGKVIEFSKQLKVKINGRLATVPLSLDSAYLWRSHGSVHLYQENGIELTWNLVHDVISIKVPRPAFLNTAGLLGTNNNEIIDDFVMPDGTLWNNTSNIKQFVDSWKVDDETCVSEKEPTPMPSATSPECDGLFNSKSSPFKYCFHHVNPEPYYQMCLDSYKGSIKDTSPSALAFKERCMENAVPVKLPVEYVKCEYTNGSSKTVKKLQEGQTVILKKDDLENAVDVVILVELKDCNRKKLRTKNFDNFITTFNDGLIKEGVQSTRFALVSYGGEGYNEKPSIVSSDTEIFTTSKNIANYLENLEFVSENEPPVPRSDSAFSAILYALNYIAFRSPVNVIFALFPCTPCREIDSFDYPTMYHSLLDNSASLYVFKNDYFDIPKESLKKKIIGYDSEVAYTIKDQNKAKMGESALKYQIVPPKTELDMCLPLALETNGMILTSEYLLESKKKVQRLGLISGRRAGQNSKADSDQRCLCLSTQEVTPDLRCDKWDHGDFSVLERYGLQFEPDSSVFSNFESDKRKGFYD